MKRLEPMPISHTQAVHSLGCYTIRRSRAPPNTRVTGWMPGMNTV